MGHWRPGDGGVFLCNAVPQAMAIWTSAQRVFPHPGARLGLAVCGWCCAEEGASGYLSPGPSPSAGFANNAGPRPLIPAGHQRLPPD